VTLGHFDDVGPPANSLLLLLLEGGGGAIKPNVMMGPAQSSVIMPDFFFGIYGVG